ncbi:hypothetical protein D3C84_179770 [compost metagenome]
MPTVCAPCSSCAWRVNWIRRCAWSAGSSATSSCCAGSRPGPASGSRCWTWPTSRTARPPGACSTPAPGYATSTTTLPANCRGIRHSSPSSTRPPRCAPACWSTPTWTGVITAGRWPPPLVTAWPARPGCWRRSMAWPTMRCMPWRSWACCSTTTPMATACRTCTSSRWRWPPSCCLTTTRWTSSATAQASPPCAPATPPTWLQPQALNPGTRAGARSCTACPRNPGRGGSAACWPTSWRPVRRARRSACSAPGRTVTGRSACGYRKRPG